MAKINKYISLILILTLVLLLGLVNAGIVKEATKYDEKLSAYSEITLKEKAWYDVFGWFEKEVVKQTLREHTTQCLIDCKSEGTTDLKVEGRLFDKMDFYNSGGTDVFVEYKIYILENVNYEVDVPDTYKEVCEDVKQNKTIKGETLEPIKNCYQVEDTYKKETRYKDEWKEYNYEILKAGIYKWKIEAKKRPSLNVDWVATSFGTKLSEWAWWNDDWDYKRSINISSGNGNITYFVVNYSANMKTDFGDLRFVNSGETAELNYTIQSHVASTNATIRVQSLGATSFYMYYGNNGVNTTSNASKVYFDAVAYYYLDELTGTSTIDSISGNNGTINGTTINAVGKINRAYNFDGTDDSVQIPDANNLDFNNVDFSVAIWFKYDSQADLEAILAKTPAYSTQQTNYGLTFAPANKLYFIVGSGATSDTLLSNTLTNGTWYHAVATFTASSGEMSLYVNGDRTNKTTAVNPASNAGSLWLGKYFSTSFYDGILDEVAIWNKVLTSDERNKLYTSTEATITVGDEESNKLTPTISLVIDKTSPQTYLTTLNISCSTDSNGTLGMFIDDVDYTTSLNQNIVIGAGAKVIKCNTTENDYYKSGTNATNFTINKATPTGTITGTSPKAQGVPVDISGVETNTGDSDVNYTLYRNGTLVSNPDLNNSLDVGNYLYVYNSTEGANYSAVASLDTFDLEVVVAPAISVILQSPSDNVYSSNNYMEFSANTTAVGGAGLSNSSIRIWQQGNDGTPSGGVTIDDGAMVFDGVDGNIRPSFLNIGNISSFSISVWVKTDVQDDLRFIFDSADGVSRNRFRLGQHTSGNGKWYWGIRDSGDGGDTLVDVYSNSAPSTTEWTHLVGWWNGTTLRLYVNNSLQTDTKAKTGTVKTDATTTVRLGSAFSNSLFFDGSIDDALIFNRALTEAEITQIYEAGREVYSPITDGLVAQYSGRDYLGTTTTPTKIIDVGDIKYDTTTQEGTSEQVEFNMGSLDDAKYNWNVYACSNDSVVGCVWATSSRAFTIDTIDPVVNIIYPVESTIYNSVIVINYTATDTNGASCWYVQNGGANSTAVSFGTNFTGVVVPQLSNAWDVYCNDSAGHIGSDSVSFTVNKIAITLNSPSNASTILTNRVTFNITAVINDGLTNLTNVSIYDNSSGWASRNSTTMSGTSDTDTLTLSYVGGTSILWTAYACDTDGFCQFANTNQTYKIDGTAPTITINAGDGLEGYGYDGVEHTINFTVNDTNLDSIWYKYNTNLPDGLFDGIMNVENSIGFGANYYLYIPNGTTEFTIVGKRQVGFSEADYNYTINATTCQDDMMRITTPNNTGAGSYAISFFCKDILITSFTYNTVLAPGGFGGTWYRFHEIVGLSDIYTNLLSTANSVTFNTSSNIYQLFLYANDTIGNVNSRTVNWDYEFDETDRGFTTPVISGFNSEFYLTTSINSSSTLSSVVLNYDGTNYSSSISSSGDVYNITNNILISGTERNATFYWITTFSDGTTYTTNSDTQEVLFISLDNCTTYTNEIFTLNLYDEQTLLSIYGDIESQILIYSSSGNNLVTNTSISSTNVTNLSICSETLVNTTSYKLSTEIRYTSDGYASEFYYIQLADLEDYPVDINLYNLNSNSSTEFLIKYQDQTLTTVEEAVVQLLKRYISEGVYRTVEAPLTSNIGTAVVHVDLNTQRYKAIVTKNGVVLDTFDNIVFNCENELSGQCTQNLFGKIDANNVESVDTENDFSGSVSSVNNTVTVTTTVPSGTPATVNVVLRQRDTYGNTYLCNKTAFSSSVSLDCEYNNTIGDSYVDLLVYKNGELMIQESYFIAESGGIDWLDNNFFIVFILLISIVGMAMTSPEWMILNAVMTLLFCGGVWLLNGMNFVVGLGSLIWLIIASVILIMKISKQEDN